MTRGRDRNTAHLVAEDIDDARARWVDVFRRDRADLGPSHAAQVAADDIDRYGPQPSRGPDRPTRDDPLGAPDRPHRPPPPVPSASPSPGRTSGIGR